MNLSQETCRFEICDKNFRESSRRFLFVMIMHAPAVRAPDPLGALQLTALTNESKDLFRRVLEKVFCFVRRGLPEMGQRIIMKEEKVENVS